MPYIERYWADADPDFCDGDGAESFCTLLDRAKTALSRLQTLPPASRIYIFSHGQFIQAVRTLVVDSSLSDREKMRRFWGKGSPAIANAAQVELRMEKRNLVRGTKSCVAKTGSSHSLSRSRLPLEPKAKVAAGRSDLAFFPCTCIRSSNRFQLAGKLSLDLTSRKTCPEAPRDQCFPVRHHRRSLSRYHGQLWTRHQPGGAWLRATT